MSHVGQHAAPRTRRFRVWPRPAAIETEAIAEAPAQDIPAGDDTMIFRVPGIDGGPGIVIPPGPPRTTRNALRGEPDLGELTLTDKPLGVLHPETAPELTEPALVDDEALQGRMPPYVPQDGGLPSAWLRAIPMAGPGSRVLETLTGLPFYAGKRLDSDVEGLCLGAAGDIWLILDTSAEVLDALETAVRQARDNRVYGGLRAPAAGPGPQAEEHCDELGRDPDVCSVLEWARDVLAAAGNLGFLSAALKRNGEGAMDVFVRRATLAGALEAGDEVAAADAANELVGIVRELCGDEAADSLARGEVPAAEVPAEPEPAADAEPEPAVAAEVAQDGDAEGEAAA